MQPQAQIICVIHNEPTLRQRGMQALTWGAGRLNILANVVRKPMQQIFAEFGGAMPSGGEYYGTGDVKYHLGTSYDRPTISGKRVHLSLLANPSHLEVSPGGHFGGETCKRGSRASANAAVIAASAIWASRFWPARSRDCCPIFDAGRVPEPARLVAGARQAPPWASCTLCAPACLHRRQQAP